MKPLLEVRDISKRFKGVVALNRVSFEVHEGEFVGIIGPNGSGKTTLFNIISGFLKPDSGRIIYRGIDITGYQPHKIARLGVARTFQIMRPLESLSVLDNVIISALPRGRDVKEARERAERVLELVELVDKRDLAARDLNASEKRRLELARALAGEPRLLLLDEVLAGLSAAEIDRSLEILRKIHRSGVTILMVEHVMRAIMRISERIVVLSYGNKIAEGRPEEVSRDPRVVEAYLGRSSYTPTR